MPVARHLHSRRVAPGRPTPPERKPTTRRTRSASSAPSARERRRAADLFKSSDYRLGPFGLAVLSEHPDVAEAAVVSSRDPRRLSVPKAFVVLRAGVAADREAALSILRFARENLAPYQRIRRIEFAELPKPVSGKIQRNQLRKLETERFNAEPRHANDHREEDPEPARAGRKEE